MIKYKKCDVLNESYKVYLDDRFVGIARKNKVYGSNWATIKVWDAYNSSGYLLMANFGTRKEAAEHIAKEYKNGSL